MPRASDTSSTLRATAAAPCPRFSSARDSSARTVLITTWDSGSCSTVPATAPSVGRSVLARVEAVDDHPPGELTAVKVGHQAAGRAQQRRLARPRQSGDHAELARLDVERHVVQSPLALRVAIAHLLEGEHGHGSIPRRSANGSQAAASIRAATSQVAIPSGARTNG